MRKSRFTEGQTIAVLKAHAAGVKALDVCRKYGVSDATLHKWKARYGGIEVSDAGQLRALAAENTKLKRLLAEAMLDNAALADIALGRF